MKKHPIFLSVVLTVKNQQNDLTDFVASTSAFISQLCTDYELIIIDNSSDDDSVEVLKKLSSEAGFPNLQIYCLTNEVDSDTLSWVGVENALGDFVAIINPSLEDISFLPSMLEEALNGADVVFADNEQKPPRTLAYTYGCAIFNIIFKWANGINLIREAPQYRVISKRVINFILNHRQPILTYRYLPATAGFPRKNLTYSSSPKSCNIKRLGDSIDIGMKLLFSTTRAPMRLVTWLSLFGAAVSLIYSIYVVYIGITAIDAAPGWVSMSLQLSGMFFLISLVLLVLGEYILNMVNLSNEGPAYHVAQEFTSARMIRREKLNIETIGTLFSDNVKTDNTGNFNA